MMEMTRLAVSAIEAVMKRTPPDTLEYLALENARLELLVKIKRLTVLECSDGCGWSGPRYLTDVPGNIRGEDRCPRCGAVANEVAA